jgi:Sap, sulfolipid-1-addressing protein
MQLDLILIGLVIALEPIPLTGYLLVLGSAGGLRKGLGFVVGWLATIVALVALTLAFTGGKPLRTNTSPQKAALIVKLLVGAGLIWWAWHVRRRPKKPASRPSWFSRIDHMGFLGAMTLGFLLQPWPLVIVGVGTVTEANLSAAATWVWLAIFCLLSASTYLAAQVAVMVWPDKAEARLAAISEWIVRNRDTVVIVLSAAIGAWLFVSSAWLLA